MLQGCAATNERPVALPVVKAVAVRDLPPSDLLVCPRAPDPFPNDGHALIPANIREPMVALGAAYADVRSQLRRLIRWIDPASRC